MWPLRIIQAFERLADACERAANALESLAAKVPAE